MSTTGGSNSGGRVPAFQAGCRGFESRLPLHLARVGYVASPDCGRNPSLGSIGPCGGSFSGSRGIVGSYLNGGTHVSCLPCDCMLYLGIIFIDGRKK